jgi:hypothetical protein
MKTPFVVLLSVFSILIFGCEKKKELPVPETPPSKAPSGSGGSLATAPVDYLATAGKAQQSMEKNIDAAALNKEVELFAAQEGRYPTDLNELVTKKYLGKLPTPPFGTKLQYNAKDGKVTVVKE